MGKEIERKFLLTKGASIPIPKSFVKFKIKQAYISLEKDKQVRIRISKFSPTIESADICVKYTGKLVRDEFEFKITNDIEEAKKLYKKCNIFVEKKRLSFRSHVNPLEVKYDVDTFPNGMQWVEVEFTSLKAMKKWEKNIPHWIGEEITGVNKYSNITLAKKKLKF